MKRFLLSMLTVAVALSVAISAAACSVSPLKGARSSYTITATLDGNKISGHMEYTLVNNGDTAITEQCFMLYGNAYKKDAAHPAVVNDKAYYAGKSYGEETVENITVGGAAATAQISGDDGEVLTVAVSELFPGEKVAIAMDFCVTLASVNHRLGITPHAINLGGWYPIAVPRVDGTSLTYPYYSIGDPFCTDAADYTVELTVPESYTVAATGDGTREGNVCRFTSKNTRDFAIVAGSEFKVSTATVGKTEVRYYYYDDLKADASLKTATDALTYFNKEIGDYPYPTLSVVETGFIHGGMEYPALVMISDACGDGYNETIVHETAHQWWYSAVGNDEVAHAWQDEGLTDYMTTLFFDAHSEYGQTRTDRIMRTMAAYLTYVDVYSDLTGSVDTSMDRPLDKFKSEQEYVTMTYRKGELMFDTLRSEIGEEKFSRALKAYYKNFLHGRATPDDMIATFSKAAGRDLNSFFRSWLDGKVVIA